MKLASKVGLMAISKPNWHLCNCTKCAWISGRYSNVRKHVRSSQTKRNLCSLVSLSRNPALNSVHSQPHVTQGSVICVLVPLNNRKKKAPDLAALPMTSNTLLDLWSYHSKLTPICHSSIRRCLTKKFLLVNFGYVK